jgi:hypothetical protein
MKYFSMTTTDKSLQLLLMSHLQGDILFSCINQDSVI